MIIIGKPTDLEKIVSYPMGLIKDVSETVSILCRAYGYQRDIYKDLGGFCCIVEDKNDIQGLLDEWKIDLLYDTAEFSSEIEGYIKKLFILSSDYCIMTYYSSDII